MANPVNFHFVQTNRDRYALVYDEYMFRVNRQIDTKKYWKCSNIGCNVSWAVLRGAVPPVPYPLPPAAPQRRKQILVSALAASENLLTAVCSQYPAILLPKSVASGAAWCPCPSPRHVLCCISALGRLSSVRRRHILITVLL